MQTDDYSLLVNYITFDKGRMFLVITGTHKAAYLELTKLTRQVSDCNELDAALNGVARVPGTLLYQRFNLLF